MTTMGSIMIQKIIRTFIKAFEDHSEKMYVCKHVPFKTDVVYEELLPVELATEAFNALGISEEGWACEDRKSLVALPDCDKCYPVYRLKGTEGVDRQLSGEVQDL